MEFVCVCFVFSAGGSCLGWWIDHGHGRIFHVLVTKTNVTFLAAILLCYLLCGLFVTTAQNFKKSCLCQNANDILVD